MMLAANSMAVMWKRSPSPLRSQTVHTAKSMARRTSCVGLDSCPSQKVIYNAQQTWNCKDAAKDYAGAVYNDRASVVLCKTLVLTPAPGTPDPVSCYALVGTGTNLDPYAVANNDDSMVFQGLASIGLTKDGKPLRPDLLKSAVMGKQMGLGNAGQ